MDELRDVDKKRFPLKTISDVVGLFEDQLNLALEPNLAFLSIVLGLVEHSLTVNKPLDKRPRGRPNEKINVDEANENLNIRLDENIPTVELDDVKLLFELFVKLIKANVDLSQFEIKNHTPTILVKKVSDVLWNTLSRTFYKDKGHLQFLYTLFNEQKMDCIGMAFGVICGCQVLGLQDVHLAITEDHVWAAFGKNENLTSEITWHGKGTEDKRGQPVTSTAPEKSWLYESPIICSRYTEVAMLVTGINPIINSTYESMEMAIIQKRILWSLYDLNHLDRYPLALGVLADLEEIHPSTERHRPNSFKLYKRAIEISQNYYNNAHIYPYTYLGNYFYRRRKYKEALRSWADAAQVASRFNYNREDDEIYKEFNEIANEIMPNIIKTCCAIQDGLSPVSSGMQEVTLQSNSISSIQSDQRTSHLKKLKSSNRRGSRDKDNASLLSNSECYADILRFYDGICEWEEGSSMPVLHIIWAKNMSFTISKFSPVVRTTLKIYLSNENEEKQTKTSNFDKISNNCSDKLNRKKQRGKDSNESTGEDQFISLNIDLVCKTALPGDAEDLNEKAKTSNRDNMEDDMDREGSDNNNTDIIIAQISLEPQDMELEVGTYNMDDLRSLDFKNSEKLTGHDIVSLKDVEKVDDTASFALEPEASEEGLDANTQNIKKPEGIKDDIKSADCKGEARLLLRSQKMASMKDLLICERLNLSAIKLLLTAQSQVNTKPTLSSTRGISDGATQVQPLRKRARND